MVISRVIEKMEIDDFKKLVNMQQDYIAQLRILDSEKDVLCNELRNIFIIERRVNKVKIDANSVECELEKLEDAIYKKYGEENTRTALKSWNSEL